MPWKSSATSYDHHSLHLLRFLVTLPVLLWDSKLLLAPTAQSTKYCPTRTPSATAVPSSSPPSDQTTPRAPCPDSLQAFDSKWFQSGYIHINLNREIFYEVNWSGKHKLYLCVTLSERLSRRLCWGESEGVPSGAEPSWLCRRPDSATQLCHLNRSCEAAPQDKEESGYCVTTGRAVS